MNTLADYHSLRIRKPRTLTEGIDRWVDETCGYLYRRPSISRALLRQARSASNACRKFLEMNDSEFQSRMSELRTRYRRSSDPSRPLMAQVLAVAGAAAHRSLGMTPYPVQFMGALALSQGYLAEMATGEGKTLTIGLAGVALGWRRLPCHILTSNDYLAQRDAEKLASLYQYCGVSVGYTIAGMENPDRIEHYRRDVTYTTSKELLADFLRDRLQLGRLREPQRRLAFSLLGGALEEKGHRVLRGIHTALVDEADSVLVDDAVTPLIISQKYKNQALVDCCRTACMITGHLRPDGHYRVDFKRREIHLTSAGRRVMDAHRHLLPRPWQSLDRSEELVQQALVAREFYLRDRDYVIEEDKVVIVDGSTGRLKRDSTWRQGLHQAIETKENLPLTDPTETMASLSFQNFFRLFPRLAGITGTASNAAREFWFVYRLPVVRVPTHRLCIRRHLPNRFFPDLESKWRAITEEVRRRCSAGQPVLIGTSSVRASEQLAEFLSAAGIKFNLLNATRHREEAEIVGLAGQRSAVTIATNMAGRGTDIGLGPGVREVGGLHVIAAERMESPRTDRQLFGRAGRQGDPGSAQAFISLEDDLLKKSHSPLILRQTSTALRKGGALSRRLASFLTAQAQKSAERKAREQREAVMSMDKWLDDALSFSDAQTF
jgi:preprotein translocase subunit SecA